MKKSKKSKKTVLRLKVPKRKNDVVVTKKLLDLSEQRLSKEISSVRLDMKGMETRMTSRMDRMDSRMDGLDSRMDSMESRLTSRMDDLETRLTSNMKHLEIKLTSSMEKMAASIFRIEALVEEQNIRNAAVLDGYTSRYDHQIRTNQRLDAIEKVVFGKEQK